MKGKNIFKLYNNTTFKISWQKFPQNFSFLSFFIEIVSD